jgi:quercetin dioxygenase-like cupin family protein
MNNATKEKKSELTTEQNAVGFAQRTEDAHAFHIGPLEEVIVKVASERINDTVCIVEHRSAPGAAPPRHLHQNEDEIFEILEGQFLFWLDGQMVEGVCRRNTGTASASSDRRWRAPGLTAYP